MKIIEVIADTGHHDTILSIAKQHQVEDIWYGNNNEDGRIATRLLVQPEKRQKVLDALQTIFHNAENYRILIIALDTSLPKPEIETPPEEHLTKEQLEEEKAKEKEKKRLALMSTREEILAQVEKDAQLDNNFILLVILSAIVAAIGLLENNLAVIVGAMVIAPLLGPNIAFSLGASLGEKELVFESLQSIFVGVIIAILFSIGIGLLWPGNFDSTELLARTDVAYSGTAIALASGAAASLSLVSGTSSVLVGVMVAVALMPPAVTIGLMLSIGETNHALGALLLLAVNIVCINLSSNLVFLFRGIKPRTWLEAHKAKQSRMLYIGVWVVMLVLLFITIYFRHNTQTY
ncbi:MAG TPA: TIGR00341 family protein [Gammaproteobacteria bacterium]|nr:TIGR00341 family protein [Gammaproteobacteria bacterium]